MTKSKNQEPDEEVHRERSGARVWSFHALSRQPLFPVSRCSPIRKIPNPALLGFYAGFFA